MTMLWNPADQGRIHRGHGLAAVHGLSKPSETAWFRPTSRPGFSWVPAFRWLPTTPPHSSGKLSEQNHNSPSHNTLP
jgi:hypothetical protein